MTLLRASRSRGRMAGALVCLCLLLCPLTASALPSGSDGSAAGPAPVPAPVAAAPQPPGLTDIHDIHPILDPGPDPMLIYYVLAAAVVAGVLAGLFYLWKKRRTKAAGVTAERVRSPLETALADLGKLEDLRKSGDRQFYFRLLAVLRHYVRNRFGINAPDMTTEEFLPKLRDLEIDLRWQQGIRALFHASDPIKFAGLPASEARMEQDLAFVKGFVEDTARAGEEAIEQPPRGAAPDAGVAGVSGGPGGGYRNTGIREQPRIGDEIN